MGPILDTIRTFFSQIQVTIAKKFFLIDSDAIICSRNTFGGISKPVFESYQLYLLKVHIPDFRLDKLCYQSYCCFTNRCCMANPRSLKSFTLCPAFLKTVSTKSCE